MFLFCILFLAIFSLLYLKISLCFSSFSILYSRFQYHTCACITCFICVCSIDRSIRYLLLLCVVIFALRAYTHTQNVHLGKETFFFKLNNISRLHNNRSAFIIIIIMIMIILNFSLLVPLSHFFFLFVISYLLCLFV